MASALTTSSGLPYCLSHPGAGVKKEQWESSRRDLRVEGGDFFFLRIYLSADGSNLVKRERLKIQKRERRNKGTRSLRR